MNGGRNYTQEHVKLIREIKGKNDYYAILGLDKTCSVEEIRRAYRKLSLKVHHDKNKAPGSEEAFKKVSKAFKCLSDDGARRQYDQIGLEEEYERSRRILQEMAETLNSRDVPLPEQGPIQLDQYVPHDC